MRIDDYSERMFYEIESIKNNWSIRELTDNMILLFLPGLHLQEIKIRFLDWQKKANYYKNLRI